MFFIRRKPGVATKFPPGRPKSCRRWGPLSGRERILSALVLLAITLWMFGAAYVEATTAALIVISLMLTMRVVSWKEMAGNHTAWTTLTLLATLVTLAGGLSRTGFVKWFADGVAAGGLSPTFTIMALVTVYFCSHYMFASLTAHTSAMMPVMLAVGLPGVPADKLALALALTTGIMGVITPHATGPACWHGSQHCRAASYTVAGKAE